MSEMDAIDGTLLGSLPGELRDTITRFIPGVLINAPVSRDDVQELFGSRGRLSVIMSNGKSCHSHRIEAVPHHRSTASVITSIDYASESIAVDECSTDSIDGLIIWLERKQYEGYHGFYLDIISSFHLLIRRFARIGDLRCQDQRTRGASFDGTRDLPAGGIGSQ